MKTFLTKAFKTVLSAAILCPFLASADLVVYKGLSRNLINGNDRTLVVNWRTVIIVDPTEGSAAILHYGIQFGRKIYIPPVTGTNLHITRVEGTSRSYTVINSRISPCELEQGSNAERVSFSGPDATLTLRSGSTIQFPKVIKSATGYLSRPGRPDASVVEEAIQCSYNRPATIASNEAGETVGAAMNRITAELIGQGYTQ